MNFIRNPSFESDWSEAKSHKCYVVPSYGSPGEVDIGNIFTPPGWTFWFYHEPGKYDQPEGRDAHKSVDKRRVRSGDKAYMYFSFWRIHDAGLLQRVSVEKGKRYRLSASAHAWSSSDDNPLTSDGVGSGIVELDVIPPLNGNSTNDALGNAKFQVGVSTNGSQNPYSDGVVWSKCWSIYNGYGDVRPSVEFTAKSDTIVVFLRDRRMWAFKHNDSYWDDVSLVGVDAEVPPPEPKPTPETPDPEPNPGRGTPREQYHRTYVLLPPTADSTWAKAVVDAIWNSKRHTFGGSADDAGIGDLDVRRVIAINPQSWGSGTEGNLYSWFRYHYPGVEFIEVTAGTTEILQKKLRLACGLPAESPPVPSPQPTVFPIVGTHDLAGAEWMLENGVRGWCTEAVYLGTHARELDELDLLAENGIRVILNLRYSWARRDGGQGTLPPPRDRNGFIEACYETIDNHCRDAWGFVIGNEANNPSEWPDGFALTPEYYLGVYNAVYDIKENISDVRLSPQAIDPFNPGWGDWRTTWGYVLNNIRGADFIALHAYDHGIGANRNEKFSDAPLVGVYYNLRVLESQKYIIPTRFSKLPLIVTETNHGADGSKWSDASAEWIPGALRYLKQQEVVGACLYRYNYDDDQYRYGDHSGVLSKIKGYK